MKKYLGKITILLASVLVLVTGAAATAEIQSTKNTLHVEKIGTTYPIAEKNAIQEIQEQLLAKEKSGELAKLQEKARQHIENHIYNLSPVEGLITAEKASVRFFEPIFMLPETIYDHEGNIVATAGTTINPLKVSPIPFKLFFFDGRSPEQIALAKKLADEYQSEFLPILTAGQWDDISEQMGQAVYYDQEGRMSRSFQLTEVPSMVSQVDDKIRIEAFKL